ncbi:hypothetical protein [Streptomyces sp. NBC_01443]|uniref:hypothetical protein n=1 Tax=Streptomyces sp. NBC_01443 TaxID=2903868 RepID=UPI002B1CABF2|nr:hypothetical protein [Streptomyces sp. NBC_01443]
MGNPTSVTVPDHHDRAAELDVCPHQQVAVVLPGKALACTLEEEVVSGALDEAALLAGFIAAQGGD